MITLWSLILLETPPRSARSPKLRRALKHPGVSTVRADNRQSSTADVRRFPHRAPSDWKQPRSDRPDTSGIDAMQRVRVSVGSDAFGEFPGRKERIGLQPPNGDGKGVVYTGRV